MKGDQLAEAGLASEGRQWTDAALAAEATGDFTTALEHWRRAREANPGQEDAYMGAFKTTLAAHRLDAADALLEESSPRFAGTAWMMWQAAQLAVKRRNMEDATRLWAELRAAHPAHEGGYRDGLTSLLHLGRVAEAETLLREALEIFPAARWVRFHWARLAQLRFDFPEAERRWAQAAAMLPKDPEIALQYALLPSLGRKSIQDLPRALARLDALHGKFPRYATAWRAHIRVLRMSGARTDAKRMAEQCLEMMPDEPAVWIAHAHMADDEDFAGAAERLSAAAKKFPKNTEICLNHVKALIRGGRLEEAEQSYAQALSLLPESFELVCGFAEIAMLRRDWPEALRRWENVQDRFPGRPRYARGILDVRAALAYDEGSETARKAGSQNTVAPDPSDRTQIFARFESLGGTGQGCEFGLAQRSAGAEPIGLMRWMRIEPEHLTIGLLDRFAGVGLPEQTVINFKHSKDDDPEYIYLDTRLKIVGHTFVNKRDMPQDEMFTKTCRRMAYLRRKLIEDLEDGEKIFVYKYHYRNLDDAELHALYRAVRSYGSNTLLYVCYADETHPSGTAVQIADGLIIGYISGFNMTREGERRTMDMPAWKAICQSAYDLHMAARSSKVVRAGAGEGGVANKRHIDPKNDARR